MQAITVDLLKKLGACQPAIDWLAAQTTTDLFELYDLVQDEEGWRGLQWASWLIIRLLDRQDRVKYAIFAAEYVLDIFEEYDSSDNRPRRAIGAAREYLKNRDTTAAVDAAYAVDVATYAAHTAVDAAYAAHTAVDAAYAAAYATAAAYAVDAAAAAYAVDAVVDAAYAAHTAVDAAYAAAYAAAAAYAVDAVVDAVVDGRRSTLRAFISYGIELLSGKSE